MTRLRCLCPLLLGCLAVAGLALPAAPAQALTFTQRLAAERTQAEADEKARQAARVKAIAAAQAEEPDWSRDYAGHGSGDIEAPAQVPRFVRSEWRANRYADGTLLTEWEVRITAAGEAVRWGIYRRYHANGRLAVLGTYRNARPAGQWLWLDETGQIQRKARQQAEYEDDLANDPVSSPRSQFRNTAGQLVAEGQLKQDKPHGLWVYFYGSGAPKAQGRYLTGIPDGTWSYFHPEGQVEQQVRFALGVPNGPYRLTYPGGQEQERGQYNAGVRTGLWQTFHPNGQKREEGAYREDLRDGEWKTWDDTGRLSARTLYAQGVARQEVQIAAPPPPPEPLVSDADALTPPRLFDAQGRPLRPEADWDSAAQASDADGHPVPLGPPPRRKTPDAPLSRWTSPTGGEAKTSLP